MNRQEELELLIFKIVRQGNNLRIIQECQDMGVNSFWALKHIVILESQEQRLKELFKIKTTFKNKNIKEFETFIKMFEKESLF